MIVNLNGKLFGKFFFQNVEGKLVFLGNLGKKTSPNMILRMTAFENLLNFGWTLISETRSSPDTTSVAV